MLLGIDFDNTIVCYDALFHRVALEGGWIPADLPVNKTEVRNHLRAAGREPIWTEMQGRVYGARMAEASPYPGVKAFFLACRHAGIPVCIVSHKTRTPFLGEPHDLHDAALRWLAQEGFFDPSGIGLTRDRVFFELTKQAKLERIGACACSHFVDDLPEFLGEAGFPPGVERILFDPNRLYGGEERFVRLESWDAIRDRFLPGGAIPKPRVAESSADRCLEAAEPFLRSCRLQGRLELQPLGGGANNQVFAVLSSSGRHILKRYFHSSSDTRDRFGAERAFYGWVARRDGARGCVPEVVGWDADGRSGLFECVEGRKLQAGEVSREHLRQALEFAVAINRDREREPRHALPVASEAYWEVSDHIGRVDQRIERLGAIEPGSDADREAVQFLREKLGPEWRQIRERALRDLARGGEALAGLAESHRCASPSDFGFHNALLASDGRLRFFDFEYAGWDDPAKLVCDFFLQPQVPVRPEHGPEFVEGLEAGLGVPAGSVTVRAGLLWPVYVVKWCCILMNEFLRTESERRGFAWGAEEVERRKAAQLAKAGELLARTAESNPCLR